MTGYSFGKGPYVAKKSASNKTFDITITVTLTTGRVFQVDPEMDVEAGGVEAG